MAFEEIIGQKRVKEILAASAHKNRIPHAFLFYGPEGVGKDAMACALAKHLNCSDPPCHTCSSCLKISKGQHPDVKMLFPHPSSLKPEEIGALIREKAQQPYGKATFTKQASISIETVRELQRTLPYRPYEGTYKVVIMSDADKMTIEAANALLKTLEEPPAATLLILTTGRPHALLPTIVSRCQKVRFDPLKDEEVEKVLIEKHEADPAKARFASRLAAGNYWKAQEFLNEDIHRLRDEALNIFVTAMSGGIAQIVETAAGITNRFYGDELKDVLRIALLWSRDLLLLHEKKEDREIVNIDRITALRKYIEQYSSSEIHNWIDELKETLELIDRNVNQHLALIGLMLQLEKRKI
ncbi:MAG: DNA polymerase III subunit delta' [Gemmatimonadota bacterium]|nr:MAG: DNA polymerase III subunit delta' [Gemmatimonadota bacterium]